MPHWLHEQAPEAYDLLVQTLAPDRLKPEHPVALVWASPSETGRKDLVRLANEIRAVRDVSGAQGLFDSMRNDMHGYFDFRYELQVASAVSRVPGQKVFHLAGKNQGPDVEFTTPSGQKCGIACYRAKSDPPKISEVRDVSTKLVNHALRDFTFSLDQSSFVLDVMFKDIPVDHADVKDAKHIITRLLTKPNRAEATRGKVRIIRKPLPRELLHVGDHRRVRICFYYRVREAEALRVQRHVNDKIEKEKKSWARSYPGIPVFAVQEPDGLQNGGLVASTRKIMDEDDFPFTGVLFTWRSANEFDTATWQSANEFDTATWLPRKGTPQDFGNSFAGLRAEYDEWVRDCVVLTAVQNHMREHWDLFRTVASCGSHLVKSQSSGTHFARVRKLEDAAEMERRMAAARQHIIEMDLGQYPKAPDLLLPLRQSPPRRI